MKICGLCSEHNAPDELFCVGCGTSLADLSVVDTSRIQPAAADDAPAESVDLEADDQSRQNRTPTTAAHTVHDVDVAQAASCALVFPWGRVPVTGQLDVGREAGFSPISGQLGSFTTVSRRHAVVGAVQGRWLVRDLGSTNGTWLNGERLAEGESRAIGNGDRVGFSRSLQVEVEIAAAGGSSGAHLQVADRK